MSERPDLPSHPDPSEDALFDNLIAASAEAAADLPAREGLPPTYKMRHDAHYVEEQETKARRLAEAVPHPDARATRAVLPASPEIPLFSVLRELCQSLGGLSSCFGLLSAGPRPLRERLGLELAQIEARRAMRSLLCLCALVEKPRLNIGDVGVADLVTHVLDEMKEELRLARIEIALDLPDRLLTVAADRTLLSIALSGTVSALVAILESAPGSSVLSVAAGPVAEQRVTLELTENAPILPVGAASRLLDLKWTERPGGTAAAIALSAACQIVRLHGGRFEASEAAEGGVKLSIALPVLSRH